MKISRLLTMTVLIGWMASLPLFAQKDKEITKTFAQKKEVRLKFALGSCTLKKSSDERIHVHLVYSYDEEKFESRMEERARYLLLEEKFHGNNHRGGYSNWTVSVPEGTEIDFRTGTGDLVIEGMTIKIEGSTGTGDIEITEANGDFDLNTGTGNIEVTDSNGEFELNSGTGKVRVENSKGNFNAKSGTGRVEANNLTIEDEGDFKCGTGDVEVISPKGDDYDLSVRSSTNDAVLSLRGIPLEGYFEFTAHARSGRIRCPVKFDKEEEYWDSDQKYMRKSFTKGKGTPRFYISTGTGRATLNR
jgi:hypothetical protein